MREIRCIDKKYREKELYINQNSYLCTQTKNKLMKTRIDIRRAIKERGYTAKDFAEKCGMTISNLSRNIINGNPTVRKLSEICEVLGCDITDLFYPIDGEEKNNIAEQGKLPETSITTPQAQTQTPVATTAFCPHCGKQVRIGVVLLPEA